MCVCCFQSPKLVFFTQTEFPVISECVKEKMRTSMIKLTHAWSTWLPSVIKNVCICGQGVKNGSYLPWLQQSFWYCLPEYSCIQVGMLHMIRWIGKNVVCMLGPRGSWLMTVIFCLEANDKCVLQGSLVGSVLFKHYYQWCGGGDEVHPNQAK